MVTRIVEFTDREPEFNRGANSQLREVVGRGAGQRERAIALGRVHAACNRQTAHGLGLVAERLYCGGRLLAGADELVNAALERGAGEYHYRRCRWSPHHLGVVGVTKLYSAEAVRVIAIERRLLPDQQEEPTRPVLLDCECDSRCRIRQHCRVRPLGS